MVRLGAGVVFGLSILTFWPAFAGQASDSGHGVPADFRLVAEYYPPSDPIQPQRPWTTTITAEGHLTQNTDVSVGAEEKTVTRTIALPPSAVIEIVDTLREARFELLAPKYSYEVTDNPTLLLRVRMDKRFHEVQVYAPAHLQNKEEVAAFLRIWKAVLRYVPSRNAGGQFG